jgi:type III secretory pathway component EscS
MTGSCPNSANLKLIAISLTLFACASWMGSSLLLYTQDIFSVLLR